MTRNACWFALVVAAAVGCNTPDTKRAAADGDTLVQEITPGIVVRTTRTANGNATSTLVDEVRGEVLANARYTAVDLTWSGGVLIPMAASRTDVLDNAPELADLNTMLVQAWKDVVQRAAANLTRYDEAGCDSIPDAIESHCRQNCCADHDKCYWDRGCTAASWDPTAEGWDCFRCNWDVAKCWGTCSFDPPDCTQSQCGCNQSKCFDRNCEAGRQFYCASDCNNGGAGPCRNPPDDYPEDACVYADGATRLSLHGGAIVACVPWCENLGLGQASGWWWSETLFCCVCESAGGYAPRTTWPWFTKPWPYPIPSIHYRGDGHFHPLIGECSWYEPGGYWTCG
jgi:hypothetical protein